MENSTPFRGWIATLSDGSTVFEQAPIPNEKTSWQKLLDRLGKENLKITSLRVQHAGVTLNALPQKQCDGYFQAYQARMTMFHGVPENSIRQAVGSVVGDKVFIHWIDDGGNVFMAVEPLSEMKIHTTLRDD